MDGFESGKTFVAGDRIASAEYVKRLNEMPALKKEVTAFLKRIEEADAGDAVVASAVEFLLEGLHVENDIQHAPLQRREGVPAKIVTVLLVDPLQQKVNLQRSQVFLGLAIRRLRFFEQIDHGLRRRISNYQLAFGIRAIESLTIANC